MKFCLVTEKHGEILPSNSQKFPFNFLKSISKHGEILDINNFKIQPIQYNTT